MNKMKIYPLQPFLIQRPNDYGNFREEVLFVDFVNKKVYNTFANGELVDNQKCAAPFKLSEEELEQVLSMFKFTPMNLPTAVTDLMARGESRRKHAEEKINNARENKLRTDFDLGRREAAEQFMQEVKSPSSD